MIYIIFIYQAICAVWKAYFLFVIPEALLSGIQYFLDSSGFPPARE